MPTTHPAASLKKPGSVHFRRWCMQHIITSAILEFTSLYKLSWRQGYNPYSHPYHHSSHYALMAESPTGSEELGISFMGTCSPLFDDWKRCLWRSHYVQNERIFNLVYHEVFIDLIILCVEGLHTVSTCRSSWAIHVVSNGVSDDITCSRKCMACGKHPQQVREIRRARSIVQLDFNIREV